MLFHSQMLTISELMAVKYYDGCVDNCIAKANLSISTEIITVIFTVVLCGLKIIFVVSIMPDLIIYKD